MLLRHAQSADHPTRHPSHHQQHACAAYAEVQPPTKQETKRTPKRNTMHAQATHALPPHETAASKASPQVSSAGVLDLAYGTCQKVRSKARVGIRARLLGWRLATCFDVARDGSGISSWRRCASFSGVFVVGDGMNEWTWHERVHWDWRGYERSFG